MIFHSSSLNTLGPDRHNPLTVEDEIEDLKKKWVEVEANDFTVDTEGSIPFSNCLSIDHGSNGTISATFSDTLGAAASLDLEFALINAGIANLNWAFSGSAGGTFATSAEYACSGLGQTIQITAVPSYYRFREARFRYLYLGASKPTNVIYEDWQRIPETQVLASSPMLKCITDPELLRCDSRVASSWNRKR